MKTLTKNANAKINLGLQVLNKREDGYHNINSIFLPVSLSDEIHISESKQYSLVSNVSFDIPDDDNLVIRAAKLINRYVNKNNCVKINLRKHIPSGAGLGGGSSDAATVLKAMNELFEYYLSNEELASLGLELGSDVPFFIYNRPVIAKGRGEDFTFIDFKLSNRILIIYPNIHISTPAAYKSLGRTSTAPKEIDYLSILNSPSIDFNDFSNDFEEFAIKTYPEIAKIKNELLKNGAFFALMSGSGSSVFGLFEKASEAVEASLAFKKYCTYVCHTL